MKLRLGTGWISLRLVPITCGFSAQCPLTNSDKHEETYFISKREASSGCRLYSKYCPHPEYLSFNTIDLDGTTSIINDDTLDWCASKLFFSGRLPQGKACFCGRVADYSYPFKLSIRPFEETPSCHSDPGSLHGANLNASVAILDVDEYYFSGLEFA